MAVLEKKMVEGKIVTKGCNGIKVN